MMYYAVKNRFSQEILITWENSPAIMLNEKSKIKVAYTVWSCLIPRALWALITELSNLCIWKHARWFYLEDTQASQIQHVREWTQPFFFLHSQICFFLHPLPLRWWHHHPPSHSSQNPEPLPLLVTHAQSVVVPCHAPGKNFTVLPSLCMFPTTALKTLWVLSAPFQVPCNMLSCHHHYLLIPPCIICHSLVRLSHCGSPRTPCCFPPLCPCVLFCFFLFLFPIYPFPSFFAWLLLFQDSIEMSSPPGRVSWFSHYF